MMNGLNNVHYHNSVSGFSKQEKYQPNTSIKTETLTDKYTVSGEIGRGKFAVVKKCVNNVTKEVVAAKCIKKRRRGRSCREEILREVVMLEMALEHPRLVDLKEVFETQSELILITEYCSGGELFTECVIEESFREHDVVRMMRQILEGLVYLHERNIVHLDLKPQNILFTEPFPQGDIKLCDLGFACLVNTGEDIRDIIGTPDYVAPEVLSYEPLGLYTDMWSLGVLTYVMLTAHSPFSGNTQQETFLNISQVNLDFPDTLFEKTSEAAIDFIQKLLVKEPSERLTAKQCLEHPWVCGSASEIPQTIVNLKSQDGEECVEDSANEANPASMEMSSSNSCSSMCSKDSISNDEVTTDTEIVNEEYTMNKKLKDNSLENDNSSENVSPPEQKTPTPVRKSDILVNNDILNCELNTATTTTLLSVTGKLDNSCSQSFDRKICDNLSHENQENIERCNKEHHVCKKALVVLSEHEKQTDSPNEVQSHVHIIPTKLEKCNSNLESRVETNSYISAQVEEDFKLNECTC